jgi:hypothetical protein
MGNLYTVGFDPFIQRPICPFLCCVISFIHKGEIYSSVRFCSFSRRLVLVGCTVVQWANGFIPAALV